MGGGQRPSSGRAACGHPVPQTLHCLCQEGKGTPQPPPGGVFSQHSWGTASSKSWDAALRSSWQWPSCPPLSLSFPGMRLGGQQWSSTYTKMQPEASPLFLVAAKRHFLFPKKIHNNSNNKIVIGRSLAFGLKAKSPPTRSPVSGRGWPVLRVALLGAETGLCLMLEVNRLLRLLPRSRVQQHHVLQAAGDS